MQQLKFFHAIFKIPQFFSSFLSPYDNKVLHLACAMNIRLRKTIQGIDKYILIEAILLISSLMHG